MGPDNRYTHFPHVFLKLVNMVTKFLNLSFLLLLLCGVIHFSEQAAMYALGECPDGHKPGDIWFKPGCQKCECQNDGYGCVSCGLSVIDPSILSGKCYVERHLEEEYPECCKPYIMCKGDKGFNETRLVIG